MSAGDTGRVAAITQVEGGVGGLAAAYQDVRALADTYDAAGDVMRGWARLGVDTLADAELLSSAILSPATFAAAEAAVLAATTGPDGVLAQSLGWEADAAAVRLAVAGLEGADALSQAALDELDRELGMVLGLGLRGASASPLLPVALRVLGELPLEQWAIEHPGLVEHLVNGGGGLLGGLLGGGLLLRDPGTAARLLARTYDDGTARTTPRPDLRAGGSRRAPSSVSDLMRRLREVAALSPGPDSPGNGTIEVQTLDAGTDRVRHIVYLPGTDDIATLPWTQDQDVRDMGTNLRLIGGLDDAYRDGILDAMHQAGVGPHDPVLLVGHSQGGMEAASILGNGSEFNVTHVVTAGSPTAQVDGFPEGSHVLSLEHRGDVVPLLDGAPNPDTVAQTTVTFEDRVDGGVEAQHGYGTYLAGAAATDQALDPSVVEQLNSLHDHGFLVGETGAAPSVTSHVYQVVRQP